MPTLTMQTQSYKTSRLWAIKSSIFVAQPSLPPRAWGYATTIFFLFFLTTVLGTFFFLLLKSETERRKSKGKKQQKMKAFPSGVARPGGVHPAREPPGPAPPSASPLRCPRRARRWVCRPGPPPPPPLLPPPRPWGPGSAGPGAGWTPAGLRSAPGRPGGSLGRT